MSEQITGPESDQYMVIPSDLDDYYKSEIEKDLDAFIAEMGESIQSATMSIYRVPVNPRTNLPMKRQMPFLFSISPGELTFAQLSEKVRDEYGTGVYKIMIRDEQNVLRKNRNFSVEAPEKPDDQNRAGTQTGLIAELTNALQANSEQMQAMYEGRNRPGIFENPVVVTALIGAVGKIFESMFDRGNREEKSTLEKITEQVMTRRAINELFDNEPNAGKEDNFWSGIVSLANSFAPAIAVAAKNAEETGAINKDGVIQKQLTGPAQPAPTPASEPSHADMQQIQTLKTQLDFLITQAANGVPVKRVVDVMIDAFPNDPDQFDAMADQLEQFLKNPAALDQCAMLDARVTEHRQWFEDFREEMLRALEIMIEDDPDLTKDGEGEQNHDTGDGGDDNSGHEPDASTATASDSGATAGDS